MKYQPYVTCFFILISYYSGLGAQRTDSLQQQSPIADTTHMLEEVTVSTGIQQLSKERVTGSFDHITNTQFNQQVGPDVLSRLEALASGYQVNRRGPTYYERPLIRGLGTINGPSDPLVVVDNFPYEGNIANINPNDVLDITVLKDAAAASIWGARAANGVIVIRTKTGRLQQPISIQANSYGSVGNKPDLSYLRQIPAADFIAIEKMLYERGFFTSKINQSAKPPLSPVVELLIQRETADAMRQAEIDAEIAKLTQLNVLNDFDTYLYQAPVQQQYTLSLSGGAEKIAWHASAGYDRNTGSLGELYDRTNLRLRQTYTPLKTLSINGELRYTSSQNRNGKPGIGDISSLNNALYPYARLADEQGNPLSITKKYRQTFIDEMNNEGKLLDWTYIPLEDYHHENNRSSLSDLVTQWGINWQTVPWARLELQYQYERQQQNGRDLRGEQSFFARDLANYYAQRLPNDEIEWPIPPGAILNLSNSVMEAHQARGQAAVNRKWSNHEINGLIGMEIRHRGMQSNSGRTYGYDAQTLTFANIDYVNRYRNSVSGSSASIPNSSNFNQTITRFISTYANASYTYGRRYTISASARRDASNLFGLDTKDQWNPFWSTGIAWNLSNESFYRSRLLPQLSLRATYGVSGNIDPAMVAVTTFAYVSYLDGLTQTPFARIDNNGNPDLRWETSRMLNLAVTGATANDRLRFSLEYFRKEGKHLFGRNPLDYTVGLSSVIQNASDMIGNGVDLQLQSINLRTAFRWSTSLNLSYYLDKVTHNYVSSASVSSLVNSAGGTSGYFAQKGKPVNALFAYRWAGLDPETGEPRGYENGEPSKNYSALTGSNATVDDLTYIGSAVPIWYGTLGNTLEYKRIALNFSFLFKADYFFRRPSVNYYNLYNNWTGGHTDASDRWQKAGDEQRTNVPAAIYPANSIRDNFYAGSEVLVDPADHVRLKYINLSYQLPLPKSSRLSDCQIYFNANDVGVVWKANKVGLDPDAVGTGMLLPTTTYALGLRLTLE